MGFGATGDVSASDAIDILSNTGSAVTTFFPFVQGGTAVGNFIKNTAISTTISTTTNMIIDAVRDDNNSQNANSNNTTSSKPNNQNTDAEK